MEQLKAPSPLPLTGNSQKNVVFERYQYWSHQMTAGTSVNRLITELRQRSKDCEFGISENDMLRDKLVLSITDSELKKRLIQERGLTFHRAIEICRAAEQENTEHGVDGELKMILPDQSLHHNTRRQSCSQSVPNTHQTETLVLAAFTPTVHLHRFQLQQPSVTDSVFSERRNEEQLLPERLHIKEEPEMLSEGQEEKQLCVQQETNSAACPVKCEDEEEKPQASQLHWRQLTEITMKEEPSTCALDEFMKKESVGINIKGPEAAQDPDQSSLVLQGPDGTETASKLRIHTGEKSFECDVCRKCFSRKVNLKRHVRIHTGEKPFKCDVCNTCFNNRVTLMRHMIVHAGEKPFKCDFCSKCFARNDSLELHVRIHKEKPFKCDVCHKCYTRKDSLQSHVRIHKEKPIKCDVCSKCFYKGVELLRHMRFHTGEKPFKCDFCSKCFYCKSVLKQHIRIHTGEKEFICDVCSKCFCRKVDLKRHMRIHTGEKPYECSVCSNCFNQGPALKRHMRTHTGEKPFKCDICSTFFTRKAHLQSHLRIHKPFKGDAICTSMTFQAAVQM